MIMKFTLATVILSFVASAPVLFKLSIAVKKDTKYPKNVRYFLAYGSILGHSLVLLSLIFALLADIYD